MSTPGLALHLRPETVDQRSMTVLGKRLEMPGSGTRLRVVERGEQEEVATFPALRRGLRKGDHELLGAAEGWTLQQRRWTRFTLLDPSGAPRATIAEKVGRPTRKMRQSWDVEVDGAPRISVFNRARLNPVVKLAQPFKGEQLSTFSTKDEGLRLHLWFTRAVLEADPVPMGLADPVVAASLLACVHDLYDHESI